MITIYWCSSDRIFYILIMKIINTEFQVIHFPCDVFDSHGVDCY